MAKWLDKYEQGGMVLKQKTHDNYGKRPNPNDVQASVGPDFVGLGYNTKGRNYSPAWGGQFAMGGSIPGATGMMYARTQDPAPSNGPYAKKTLASAQNGTEMKFYQEGLDFKPKSISKNGRKITKAEFGDYFQSSGQASIGKGIGSAVGSIFGPLGSMVGGTLGSVVGNLFGGADDANKLANFQTKTKENTERSAWAAGAKSIHGANSSFMNDGGNINKKLKEEAEERLSRMGKPKSTISQYTPKTGEAERLEKEKAQRREENAKPLNRLASNPNAEAFGRNIPDAALFALDVMTLGEGALALKGLAKPALEAAGKYLTEKTALKNAYKLNPKAFKANPEAFYRQVYGNEAYNSFLQHGPKTVEQITSRRSPAGQLIDMTKNWPSASTNVVGANETIASKVMPNTSTLPYFKKGNPYYAPSFGESKAKEYLFETKPGAKDIEDFIPGAGFNIHDINSPLPSAKALSSYEGRNVLHPMSEFNSPENYNVYQRNWLKGYKKVSKKKNGGWLEKYK